MYKTEKYDWSKFEEISLDSDRLLFEITYQDPTSQYYCANTGNMGSEADVKSGKLEMPIKMGGTTDDSCGQGPIKLSEAINRTADCLPEGSMITHWEIKPCNEDGNQESREPSEFVRWMWENSARVGREKQEGKRRPDGKLVHNNVVKLPGKAV